MNQTAGFVSSLDKSWEDFSNAWKKARAKASEKSIHDLRVSTRRLIAILELAKVFSRHDDLPDLQRRFKKVLKSMGPLRDTQVLMLNISQLQQSILIEKFKKTLARREQREIESIRDHLRRGRKQKLEKGIDSVRSEFTRLHESLDREKIRERVDGVLKVRRNALLKTERRFQRSRPVNEDLLHEMRIALKKLRYVVEAAQPILGEAGRKQARQMHGIQTLIGDSRDVEMLRKKLEKWGARQGKTIAVVPALDQLQQKRQMLLKKIIASSTTLEKFLDTETRKQKPVIIEQTQASTSLQKKEEEAVTAYAFKLSEHSERRKAE